MLATPDQTSTGVLPLVLSLPGLAEPVLLTTGRWGIGSAPSNQIVLARPGVAPRHCLILATSSHVVLKSWVAGTFVDGVEVPDAELSPGQVLQVGDCELTLRRADARDLLETLPEFPSEAETRAESAENLIAAVPTAAAVPVVTRGDSLQTMAARSAAELQAIEARTNDMLQTLQSLNDELLDVETDTDNLDDVIRRIETSRPAQERLKSGQKRSEALGLVRELSDRISMADQKQMSSAEDLMGVAHGELEQLIQWFEAECRSNPQYAWFCEELRRYLGTFMAEVSAVRAQSDELLATESELHADRAALAQERSSLENERETWKAECEAMERWLETERSTDSSMVQEFSSDDSHLLVTERKKLDESTAEIGSELRSRADAVRELDELVRQMAGFAEALPGTAGSSESTDIVTGCGAPRTVEPVEMQTANGPIENEVFQAAQAAKDQAHLTSGWDCSSRAENSAPGIESKEPVSETPAETFNEPAVATISDDSAVMESRWAAAYAEECLTDPNLANQTVVPEPLSPPAMSHPFDASPAEGSARDVTEDSGRDATADLIGRSSLLASLMRPASSEAARDDSVQGHAAATEPAPAPKPGGLRHQLASMFNMPEIEAATSVDPDADDHGGVGDLTRVGFNIHSQGKDEGEGFSSGDDSEEASPLLGLEGSSSSEGLSGDSQEDSVGSYMRALLARNRRQSGAAPVPVEPPPAEPDPVRAKGDREDSLDRSWITHEPAHKQDKDAVRAEYQALRSIANLSARSHLAESGQREKRKQMLVKSGAALLALTCGGAGFALQVSPVYSWITLGIGVLFLIDLGVSSKRNMQHSRVDNLLEAQEEPLDTRR